MTPPKSPAGIPVLLLALLVLLGTTAFWLLRPGERPGNDGPMSGAPEAGSETVAATASADDAPESAGPAKHSDRRARPGERPEDAPAAAGPIDDDAPDLIRSQVRAVVPAGHSMVTGGHRLADGSREFTVITPKWMETAGGAEMIEMEVEMLRLDAAGVTAAGLDTLATEDRKSEQNAEVWTPEELARTMKDVDQTALQSKPRVVTTPGSPARITVASQGGVQLDLGLSATGSAEGGFELTTDLKRIE